MTPNDAISINEKASYILAKQAQDSWVEGNAERLSRAIGN